MLHCSVLPVHRTFARLLSNLRYVVVDEGHAYRCRLALEGAASQQMNTNAKHSEQKKLQLCRMLRMPAPPASAPDMDAWLRKHAAKSLRLYCLPLDPLERSCIEGLAWLGLA